MATFKELYVSSGLVSDTRKNCSSSPKITLDRLIPYVGTKSLLLQAMMFGVTVKALHLVHFMLLGVEFSEKRQNSKDWLPFQDKDRVMWIKKPSLVSNRVKVRCSCPDFYFTFAYYDWLHQVLWSTKPKPYKRITANRPHRNPPQVVDVCLGGETNVLMGDYTTKFIKDVKEGDVVISGKGIPRKVLATSSKVPDEKVLEVSVTGRTRPIITTESHKFLVLMGNESCQYSCWEKIRKRREKLSQKFYHLSCKRHEGQKPADTASRVEWKSNLVKSNLVLSPKLKMEESADFSVVKDKTRKQNLGRLF
jgi:hypothetical protein